MDLIDSLSRLASRLPQQLPLLTTEEATKNALVMPLINALGYNVFDPLEVVPEFIADVGIKKGEKVDYAIMIDGKPMILIECKAAGAKLNLKHSSQLYRYFGVTDARFAVLTDGIQYQFFTDIESPNKMDEKPFFDFKLNEVDQRVAEELKKFAKPNFDLDNILSNANELKYRKHIGRLFAEEYESPSEDLVRLFTGKVYSGRFTAEVRTQFTDLVKFAFRDFVRTELNDRLKSAFDRNAEVSDEPDFESDVKIEVNDSDDGIETTAEEIEGFHIVRALLSKYILVDRVVMRDTKSYCGVLLDDNNRKPICRLRFNSSQKYIGIFDAAKKETKTPLEKLSDIYAYSDTLVATAVSYDEGSGVSDAAEESNTE